MVILGLGNPGRKYLYTRHNVGILVVSEILSHRATAKIQTWKSKYFRAWDIEINLIRAIAAKPAVFMNENGKAALGICSKFHIKPSELFVIYDDVNLPLGRLRIRKKGSAGGHKGVQSIIETLATDNFPRLKIGIGRPAEGDDLVEYVLSGFAGREKVLANEMVRNAADVIELILKEGIDKTMAKING